MSTVDKILVSALLHYKGHATNALWRYKNHPLLHLYKLYSIVCVIVVIDGTTKFYFELEFCTRKFGALNQYALILGGIETDMCNTMSKYAISIKKREAWKCFIEQRKHKH